MFYSVLEFHWLQKTQIMTQKCAFINRKCHLSNIKADKINKLPTSLNKSDATNSQLYPKILIPNWVACDVSFIKRITNSQKFLVNLLSISHTWWITHYFGERFWKKIWDVKDTLKIDANMMNNKSQNYLQEQEMRYQPNQLDF